MLPGIDQAEAAAFEIGNVARGQNGTARTGDGGDLRVEVRDRTALTTAPDGDLRKRSCGALIEGENVPGKNLAEHSFRTCKQGVTALSMGQQFDSV